MPYLIGFVILAAALVLAYRTGESWGVRRRALIRLYAVDDPRAASGLQAPARDNAIVRWLARAGYRRPNAQTVFLSATIASVALGLVISQFYRLVIFRPLLVAVLNVPGSAGDMLVLVLQSGPWILFTLTAVRGSRGAGPPP